MKKLAIGCLIILVLGGIGLAVGAYFLYRAASPVIQNARGYLDRLTQLGELEKQITNRSEFASPASGELTKEQVDRFARVQQHVRAQMGQRIDEIESKYKHLKGNQDTTREPSFGDVMSAFADLANVAIDARRFQVEALNREGFSSSEYSWVRGRVYQAAGVEVTSAIDFEQIADAARRGTGIESIETPRAPTLDVPAKNRELVKPYVKQMDEWLPLAFFGL